MKNLVIVIVVVAILGAGYFWYSSQNKNTANQNTNTPTVNNTNNTNQENINAEVNTNIGVDTNAVENILPAEAESQVRAFTITGSNFEFSIKEMTVNQGDTVKVTFYNNGGTHDWVLDEFNARTQRIGDGQSETVEFVADKTGTFEYYCSVGQHRAMGMKGNLIVQ